jgi:hypothetical protein
LELHASHVWEAFCRRAFPGSKRYWESDLEIDLVAPLQADRHLVAECKWKALSDRQEEGFLADLRARFARTALSKKLPRVDFRILSKNSLPTIAAQR